MSKFDGHTGPWTKETSLSSLNEIDRLLIQSAPALIDLCIRQNEMLKCLQKFCSDEHGLDHCGACSKISGYTDGTCKANEIVDEAEELLK